METYTVTRKRSITAEEQHLCGVCQEPATSGCTDAIETAAGWTQSKPRYGCDSHPVKPVEHFLNANS